MMIDMLEYNTKIIEYIRENTKDLLSSNVYATFPNSKMTYPLCIVDSIQTPTEFLFDNSILKLRINVFIDIYDKDRTNVLKIVNKINDIMIKYGYTINTSSQLQQATTGEYYVTKQYNISFNNQTKKYERTL